MDPNAIYADHGGYWLPVTPSWYGGYPPPPPPVHYLLPVHRIVPAKPPTRMKKAVRHRLVPAKLPTRMKKAVRPIPNNPPWSIANHPPWPIANHPPWPVAIMPATAFATMPPHPPRQQPVKKTPTTRKYPPKVSPTLALPEAGTCVEPTLRDVVSGRGRAYDQWPTNKWFISLLEYQKEEYRAATTPDARHGIIRDIVSTVLSSGGRFLKREKTGVWTLCTLFRAQVITEAAMERVAFSGNNKTRSSSKDTNSGTALTTPPTSTTTKNAQPNMKDPEITATKSSGTNQHKVYDIDTNNDETQRSRSIKEEQCEPCKNEDENETENENETSSDVSRSVYSRPVALLDPKVEDDYDSFPHYRSNIEDDDDEWAALF